MPMNIPARAYREMYERLEAAAPGSAGADVKTLVDDTFNAVAGIIKTRVFNANGDDVAEALVGALLWYFLESNPSFRAAIPPGAAEIEAGLADAPQP